MATNMSPGIQKNRLVSLDALRGFDMFWIIGAQAIADGTASLDLPWAFVVARQLTHTKWNGFSFYDLIFPLFIFITGVSLALSLKKRKGHGEGKGIILKHILKRTTILFALGIVYNLNFRSYPNFDTIRIMGVLQRIALCYFFVSLITIYTKKHIQAAIVPIILIGYWAMMRFVPVPGFGAGIWTEQGNLEHYVDSLLLPGRLYHGSWDPEGILSTLPAVATCLLGVMAGHLLRVTEWKGKPVNPQHRVLVMVFSGIGLTVIGLLMDPIFPINKNLWSSSFVLFTAGLSTILLAVFHLLIDLRGYRQWAFPFVVIGMNSIFIYLAARFIPFDKIAHWLTAGTQTFLGQSLDLVTALIQLFLEWLLLFFLYKRKIYIKI
jgi:predicted acyltransferase